MGPHATAISHRLVLLASVAWVSAEETHIEDSRLEMWPAVTATISSEIAQFLSSNPYLVTNTRVGALEG